MPVRQNVANQPVNFQNHWTIIVEISVRVENLISGHPMLWMQDR